MPGSTPAPFASEAFRGKSANGPWGDCVEEIDWSTGQILDALKQFGLEQQTLVIWTNDNGAPAPQRRGGSNLPWKGDAYSVAEGGMRVPFIARWKGRIPGGAVCSELISLMDLYPTLALLAGAEIPTDREIDGHDIRPLLFAESGAVSPYEAFYYYYVNQLQAVRSGPWKLYLRGGSQPDAVAKKSCELYNLAADPQEEIDLADHEIAVVERLQGLLQKAREDLGELGRQDGFGLIYLQSMVVGQDKNVYAMRLQNAERDRHIS